MRIVGLQSSKSVNRIKIVYLSLLLPLAVYISMFITIFFFVGGNSSNQTIIGDTLSIANQFFIFLVPIMIIWLVVGIYLQKKIIFSFTGAEELERKKCPQVYNLVENLCISRGLKTPKIGIIDDPSMNAFATGWSKNDSWVVFSKGLLKGLNTKEIEAVAAHEITHIENEDVKTMVIVNVFIGMIGTIGYILLRSGVGGGNKKANIIPIIGLVLYLVSLIILPLINFAVSRKKEFLADAGCVELTKENKYLISALEKISKKPRIKTVQDKGSNIASMFIFNPKTGIGLKSEIMGLFSTHPSMEKRIEMLKIY